MVFKKLTLQNFRNYTKSEFDFGPKTTIIVGPNAVGKSNLIEALFLLSSGKSFRTDKDKQLLQFGKNVSRVKGSWGDKDLVNGVPRRRADFRSYMKAVLFTPSDLDIVSGQPGNRRRFLDEVLEQTDAEYSHALLAFGKALRQRNALLEQVQLSGVRSDKVFSYWDDLIIKNGQIITKKRQDLIKYINNYDSSIISTERLLQYKQAEVGAGVTLVGPHRDDVIIKASNKLSKADEEVRYFGSRGQQRLVSLELKLAQIAVIKERLGEQPILLLDDVFSELDESNINHVLELMNIYQTIATATHKEFIGKKDLVDMEMIELGR
jgi:DNA replication and repair protein RecF